MTWGARMKAAVRRRMTGCLVRPGDIRPRFDGFEVIGAFNPAAVEFGDRIALLIRVAERPAAVRDGFVALPYWDWQRGTVAVDWRSDDQLTRIDPRMVRLKENGNIRLTFISWLLVAFSRDGVTIDSFGSRAFAPSERYESFGVEDPRLTRIGDRFYFTYVAVSGHGVATSLASTADFSSFQRHGIIFCPENKDVVLFPEKIDGQYLAMHRPNVQSHFGSPEIWTARSPDLLHWGEHRRLLGSEVAWATSKIGGGTPPLRTDRGWLSLFHGHVAPGAEGGVGRYAAAALLLDLERPESFLGTSSRPVMVAEEEFERSGFLPDIVFPTAAVRRDDDLLVYYGAADTSTGVVQYALDDVLGSIESASSRP